MTDDDAARERRQAQTRREYLAAIGTLFKLLETPASEKGPDHREKVMAANNACGKARLIMIEAWEGEVLL